MPRDTTKETILRMAGYTYVFDRMAYVNRSTRKVFSYEAVEDNTEEWLRKSIAEPNETGDWAFYFNASPSQAVRRALLNELE